MTKSTITRERLEKIKSWRETYGAGSNVTLPAEEAEELARIALAAMDSETVADDGIYRPGDAVGVFNVGCETCPDHLVAWTVKGQNLPAGNYWLYISQQPAPVVPDEAQSREAFEKWCSVNIERNKWHPEFYAHLPAREQWSAWEACRVAMLNGGKS